MLEKNLASHAKGAVRHKLISFGRIRRCCQLLGRRGHPQFVVITAEQALQKEIAPDELMPCGASRLLLS
jgi:hypothetical protein